MLIDYSNNALLIFNIKFKNKGLIKFLGESREKNTIFIRTLAVENGYG